MNIWNQYQQQQQQQSITPPLYTKDEIKDEHKFQFQPQQQQETTTKIRTSIGSCDDSGVVNNISTEGSSSNTPPTVYRSPTSADNSTLYPSYFHPNPAYYYNNQNYGMVPSSIYKKEMNTSGEFDNVENIPQYYAQSLKPLIDDHHHYHPYSGKFLHPHHSEHAPAAYYNNVNFTYNYNGGYPGVKPNLPHITTSSPIPVPLPQPTLPLSNSNINILPQNLNSNPNVKVKLQDMSLWKSFNEIGTEMIITKSGRRMFPSLRMSVSGLEASSKYIMFIDVVPFDDNRYKYHNCEWIISGKAEPHFGGRAYLHPDSPMSGSQWMKQVISFHKLKLTNNPLDRQGHVS
jgi:hypothetical protein